MAYKVSLEYRKRWRNGRRIVSPKWKKEVVYFKRKDNRGVFRGAKSYPQHFIEVYGDSNVRKVSIVKSKKKWKGKTSTRF